MDEQLQQILENLPEDEPRSRLEPFREFILRWRRQGRSYHSICKILAEKCGVKVSYPTLYYFVRRRSRPRKVQPEVQAEPVPIAPLAPPPPAPAAPAAPEQAAVPSGNSQTSAPADRWAAERERMRQHKEEPVAAPAPKPKRFTYTDEDCVKPLY